MTAIDQTPIKPTSITLAWFKALRPTHWVKNVLVFAPLILAGRASDVEAWLGAGFAFAALSAAASAGYLVNDIRDRDADRLHPEKRSRPFAAGHLTARAGAIMAAVLAALGAGLAGAWSLSLGLTVVVYMVGTIAYSTGLKREPVFDVVALAALYMLRLTAGGVASGAALSQWFLAFGGLFFMSLAFAKRHTELRRQTEATETPGRGYAPSDWAFTLAAGLGAGFGAVVVFLLYVALNGGPSGLYSQTAGLWVIGGLVAVWLLRLWFTAHRGALSYDPIVWAFKDRLSRVLGVIAVGCLFASF
jgi:4-hydroxybenzoate polyprenyltransferase